MGGNVRHAWHLKQDNKEKDGNGNSHTKREKCPRCNENVSVLDNYCSKCGKKLK